jgi:ankyrin repeat protein
MGFKLFCSNIKQTKNFVKKGANVNVKDELGRNPLFSRGFAKQNILIKNKADIKIKDKEGMNPLFSRNKQTSLEIEGLIKNGVDPLVKDIYGRTPLFYAKNESVAQSLVENGVPLDAVDNFGRNTLFYTTTVDTHDYLIKKGINTNIVDKKGQTPLFTNITALNFIKNINHVDKNGRTALFEIIRNYEEMYEAISSTTKKDFIYILLRQGADPNISDQIMYVSTIEKENFREKKSLSCFIDIFLRILQQDDLDKETRKVIFEHEFNNIRRA